LLVAGNGHNGSDVTRHHAGGADDHIITNGDSRQQNRASADPEISADDDGLTALEPSQPLLVFA
jgi:hypothetical protein